MVRRASGAGACCSRSHRPGRTLGVFRLRHLAQQGELAGAAGAGHRPLRGFPRRQGGGDGAGPRPGAGPGAWQSVRAACPPFRAARWARGPAHPRGPLGPTDSSLEAGAARRPWSGRGRRWGGGLFATPSSYWGGWGGRPVSGTHNRYRSTSRVAVSCLWILRHRVLTSPWEGLARLSV